MPTYDYQCRSCGVITEVVHSMLEDGPSVCERCGGDLRRVVHATGIIFRGSGFYKTDSRSSSSTSVTGSRAPTPSADPPKETANSDLSSTGSPAALPKAAGDGAPKQTD